MTELPTVIKLREGEVKLVDLPGPLLASLMLKWREVTMQIALAAEVQRRAAAGIRFKSYVIAKANRSHPPPCACGRKGTHIVGLVTYCGRTACLQPGVNRLKVINRMIDRQRTAVEPDEQEIRRRSRHADMLNKLHSERSARKRSRK